MSSITDNIRSVTRRIQKATLAAGRADGSVRLLAVSKTRPADDLRQAAAAGQQAFGEKYRQGAMGRIEALGDRTQLGRRFVGPIQSNKARALDEHRRWVHSVDRLKVARRLGGQRPASLPPLNICLQVNIDNEASKSGCAPEHVPELAAAVSALPGLSLRGLMTIPDPHQPEQELRNSFRQLAEALGGLRRNPQVEGPLDTLSMGMSGDLELAIAEGATLVRVGTALFGPRDYHRQTGPVAG